MVPNPQQTQQFLSSVLSQRGPSALPYHEDTKWLIRQHLVNLTANYPSLDPKTATFTHNDGRTVNLLQADGTIPMTFQGVTYNIPIIIWLIDSYPRHPPLVYVNPTRDMIIKRPHPFVNPSGLVSIPYLQNWVYPSSNLVDLVRNLSAVFGRDPPLYSQRRPQSSGGSNESVNVYHAGHQQRPGIPPPRGSGSVGGSGVYPMSPYGVGARMEDPNEVYKRNAVNKIVEMVHGDMVGLRKAREADMEGLFSVQSVLKQREGELEKGVKEMQDEKEGLEQQLQMVLMNTDVLEGWVKENHGKSEKVRGVEVDDAFDCVDSLSKQMLQCTAMDLAVEDTIYSLDKAVQDGAVPFDQYLRSVRLLSREQFFHRAAAAKVRASQMQAQVAHMAARVNQFVGN